VVDRSIGEGAGCGELDRELKWLIRKFDKQPGVTMAKEHPTLRHTLSGEGPNGRISSSTIRHVADSSAK